MDAASIVAKTHRQVLQGHLPLPTSGDHPHPPGTSQVGRVAIEGTWGEEKAQPPCSSPSPENPTQGDVPPCPDVASASSSMFLLPRDGTSASPCRHGLLSLLLPWCSLPMVPGQNNLSSDTWSELLEKIELTIWHPFRAQDGWR